MKKKEDLKMNDYLALKRSELANDRTLLAFMRTGLMFFVSGVSIIKILKDDQIWVNIGYVLIPVSIITSFIGIFHYIKVKKEFHHKYK